MAKTSRKAGKRGKAADRGGLPARKSAVSKSAVSPKPKSIKAAPRKPKPAPAPQEIEQLKRQLKAARTQQQASAEILRAVANASGEVAGPLQLIAETTAGLFKASSVSIQLAEGSEFTQEYRVGAIAKRVGSAYPRSNIKVGGRNLPGTVVAESRQIHIPDLDRLDPSMADFPGLPHARAGGARTVCGTPLRRDGKAIGALIVFRDRLLPFTDEELALLQSFADQAVIAIENTRLFNETQEALERQTASANILKVIASSPSDVQPVFNAVVLTARRLLGREGSAILICGEDATFRAVAAAGPDGLVPMDPIFEVRTKIDPEANFPSRAIVSKKNLHLPDWSVIDLPEQERNIRDMIGWNSTLYLPMLRGEECIGVLLVGGTQPGVFSTADIALAESFRDQAVIAIENVRLFNETREALERQTATADILKIISRSVAHAAPVFDTILESCQRLFDPFDAAVYIVDGEMVKGVARRGSGSGDWGADATPLAGSSTGLAIAQRRPLHFPDLADKADLPKDQKEAVRQAGGLTVLYAPIMSESRGVGSLVVTRQPKKPFTETEIEFIQSFADQAAIAIENARLFNETREALERQTATAEVLQVISNSISEATPVFERILESTERLITFENAAMLVITPDEHVHLAAFRGSQLAAIQSHYPRPLAQTSLSAMIATRRQVCYEDAANGPDVPEITRQIARATAKGNFSLALTPLMWKGSVIGMLNVSRDAGVKFNEKELSLLRTFADQAVIAIQNARLFNETREALERQTATSDILNVIAGSPTDTQPVFDAIARSAAELCEGTNSGVFRLRDGLVGLVGHHNLSPEQLAFVPKFFPAPLHRGYMAGRAIVDRAVAHVPDIAADPEYSAESIVKAGFRSAVSVPMFRNGEPIGAINVTREETRPFSARQIELLKTFADQAVIAIENTRLFNEVEARTRDLTESLQFQTATSEVLRVISRSPDSLQPVLDVIVETSRELCSSDASTIFLIRENKFHVTAVSGSMPSHLAYLKANPQAIDQPGSVLARMAREKRTLHIPNVADDPELSAGAAGVGGPRALLVAPLMRDGVVVGGIVLRQSVTKPFTARQIGAIETFADQAVIAIENARLFDEVQARTRDLGESLQQQTATADVLKVISRSAFDLDAVMHTLARSAAELCAAGLCGLYIREGDFLVCRGYTTISKEQEDFVRQARIPALDPNFATNRVLSSGEIANIGDFKNERSVATQAFREKLGFKSLLMVPLMRAGQGIGVFVLGRDRVGQFSPRHVELVQTFADQAVIAIENARLFDETQEALARQTATSDILRVISGSPTDVQPVFNAIVQTAVRLIGCDVSFILGCDGAHFWSMARCGKQGPIEVTNPRRGVVDPDANFPSRAIVGKQTLHLPDWAEIELPPFEREIHETLGYKSAVYLPLLRDGDCIGVLGIAGTQPRMFREAHITLAESFRDQAVIAIENTRLFEEVQARTRDLSEALEQQTATSDILRVISQSPTEVQPVFDAIVETAVRLIHCEVAFVLRTDGKTFSPAAAAGPDGPLPDLGPSHLPIDPAVNFPSRAIVAKQNVYLPDWSLIDLPEHERQMRELIGVNSSLFLPLLRDGECIGVLALASKRTNIFGESEIALAESFRDQAVIAIENTRLFNETQEALERQTATADILKVIASSPDDVQPVFQAIAERSNNLVGGFAATVGSIVDDVVHLSAFTSTTPAADAALRAFYPRPLSEFSYGDAIRSGETHRITDIELEPGLEPDQLTMVRQRGWRSALWVPLLLEGKAIGVIGVTRVAPGAFADHHVDMLETFADQAVIAISNVKLFKQVQERTRELSRSLDDLRAAQDRLVQTEKLASLGQLTAGIAHEIKNPLNFVNNFSALSVELIDEMSDVFANSTLDEAGRKRELDDIRALLKSNLEKVVQHGKRADSIVKNMLLHSREGSGEQRSVDINALVDESLNLAYHGARAEKPEFNITLQRDLDPDAGVMALFPQEITRVLLNLISNGFYAASKRKAENGETDFEPVLSAATRNLGSHVEVRIRDNGTGIPPEVKEKIFNPFFTTKPAGEGTGLGLSMSHDIIVKQHGGRIEVDTEPGEFTEFRIVLPRAGDAASGRKN